jgi:hypothetical protein
VPAPPVERQAYTCREQFGSRSDKAVRAQSIRGRMAMLGLYVRQGALWLAALRAELLLAGGSSLAIIGPTVIVFIEGMITLSRIGSNRNAIAEEAGLTPEAVGAALNMVDWE